MGKCKKYLELPEQWKIEIRGLIDKMIGKSNLADVLIEDSDLHSYDFKVTVYKYNSVKGWATIGYIRHDIFKGSKWRLTYKPRTHKGEISNAGKTASYG